jgi:hypothetical protein
MLKNTFTLYKNEVCEKVRRKEVKKKIQLIHKYILKFYRYQSKAKLTVYL